MLPPHERCNLIVFNRIVLDAKRLGVGTLAGVYREYIRVRASDVVVFTSYRSVDMYIRVDGNAHLPRFERCKIEKLALVVVVDRTRLFSCIDGRRRCHKREYDRRFAAHDDDDELDGCKVELRLFAAVLHDEGPPINWDLGSVSARPTCSHALSSHHVLTKA